MTEDSETKEYIPSNETAEIFEFPNPDELEEEEEITEQDIYDHKFHEGAAFQRELEERHIHERKFPHEHIQSMVNVHIVTDGDVTLNTPQAMEQFILVQSEQIETLNKMLIAEKTKYKILMAQLRHFEILKKE